MDVTSDAGCREASCCKRKRASNSCDERRNQGVSITVVTLHSILDDNSRLFEFLKSSGVLADKYICARCLKPMSCVKVPTKRSSDGLMWRCRKDKVWRSIRKGTWFENARVTIRVIVLMTYCFCVRKSVLSTSLLAGVSETSVLDWFLSCREICSALVKKRGKIGGPGVVVEVGESPFGSVKNHMGKYLPELWVWGAVVCGKERGELVLNVVERRDARNLRCLIEEHVEDGTVICSDKWESYEDEGEVDLETFAADHNYQFRNKVVGIMEQHWDEVKRLVGRGKRRRSGLQNHLDEYVWRESVFGHECVFNSFLQSVGTLYVPFVADPAVVVEGTTPVVEDVTPVVEDPTLAIKDPTPAAGRTLPTAVNEYPLLAVADQSSPVAAAVQPKERPARHRKRVVREGSWYPSTRDLHIAYLED
ncbi:uncharacterized protein LOC124553697 [Schistocerca americana]|uniref:uncharacterized protein LOC124553697 n=1 Tax=Schistocerca americana TaxID=7009 RepID=UPI001F4F1E8B|nr:uncharacterized protein LOC124553697 [Schistocerca americana]XP_046983558.1 uncharacterized protein LOC124553697 [Schistocerca americana]XP_046983559.1 uncharacterized protein LOC124553697 [Schistocerca americana]XP_049946805.1 uncharacterized protein LOC126443003 [Schistocerca serialis cubense]XP_049946806.1 uncharacterized protein LOC126443003 [Schistocerca serialis cubense]XP_049946807.1 uncharacterized protein LOC126443003 [Schistocerca serialis cubense]